MIDITIRPDGAVIIGGLVAGLAADAAANWPDHAERIAALEAERVAALPSTAPSEIEDEPALVAEPGGSGAAVTV